MTVSTFTCPGTVHFGVGAAKNLPNLVPGRFFLFVGSSPKRHQSLLDGIGHAAECVGQLSICGEPSVETTIEAAERLTESKATIVVAIGGGSVLDAAKAAAAFATNPGSAYDYLEVVGKGLPLENDPLPMIAVPTTFGTGSEVTRNAVLGASEHGRKVSMRDPRMVPQHAIVDPDLAIGLPRPVAATSGIDALVHVSEAYVCNVPCVQLDAACEDAIRGGFLHIRDFCDKGDSNSRHAMAKTSLCGGHAIANAKLGAVHGFAGVIGGMTGAAHGAICASLFPHVFTANIKALETQGKGSNNNALSRMEKLAELALGDGGLEVLPDAIASMVDDLGVPTLGELGVSENDHETIATKAKGSSSMKGNPVDLSHEELLSILSQAH